MSKLNQLLTLALVSGAVATTLVSFDSDARGRGVRGERGEVKAKSAHLFDKLDVDQDGQLVLTELTDSIPARAEQRLLKEDTDNDGLISFEEAMGNRPDDALDLSEYGEQIAQCVADVEADRGNYYMVPRENYYMVPEESRFKSPGQRFAMIDTEDSGFIDQAELTKAMTDKVTAHFEVMDVNEDGVVTKEEYRQYARARKANYRAVRNCINEIKDEQEIYFVI